MAARQTAMGPMRRPAPACEWGECAAAPVGFRTHWKVGSMFVLWFCRRHQRRWDRGVRQRHRAEIRSDFE